MKKLTALLAIVTIFTACKHAQRADEINDLESSALRGHIKSISTIRYYNDHNDFVNGMPEDTSRYTEFISRYDAAGYLTDETVTTYSYGSVNISYKNVYQYDGHRTIAMDLIGMQNVNKNDRDIYTWKNNHEYTVRDTANEYSFTAILDDRRRIIKDFFVTYENGKTKDSSITESEFDAAGRLSKTIVHTILPQPKTYVSIKKVISEDREGNPTKIISYRNDTISTVSLNNYEYYDNK